MYQGMAHRPLPYLADWNGTARRRKRRRGVLRLPWEIIDFRCLQGLTHYFRRPFRGCTTPTHPSASLLVYLWVG